MFYLYVEKCIHEPQYLAVYISKTYDIQILSETYNLLASSVDLVKHWFSVIHCCLTTPLFSFDLHFNSLWRHMAAGIYVNIGSGNGL